MNSSDDRPTKQQKRPTHEDIPDVRTRTAVQQAYDNERANPGGWKERHARADVKAWHAKLEERARRRRAQAKKTANDARAVSPRTCHAMEMANSIPGATSRPRTDDAPDEKDGSPPSKSSDDRPHQHV